MSTIPWRGFQNDNATVPLQSLLSIYVVILAPPIAPLPPSHPFQMPFFIISNVPCSILYLFFLAALLYHQFWKWWVIHFKMDPMVGISSESGHNNKNHDGQIPPIPGICCGPPGRLGRRVVDRFYLSYIWTDLPHVMSQVDIAQKGYRSM